MDREKPLRLAKPVVIITVSLSVYLFGRVAVGGSLWPESYYEIPLLIAPMSTIAVSLLVFIEFTEKSVGVRTAHFLAALVVFVACFFLPLSQTWVGHLGSMAVVFITFLIWDIVLLRDNGVPEDMRKEVAWGHLHINLPTCGAVFWLPYL